MSVIKGSCALSYATAEVDAQIKYSKSFTDSQNNNINLIITRNNLVVMQNNNMCVEEKKFNKEVIEVEANYVDDIPTLYVGYYLDSVYVIQVINSKMSMVIESYRNTIIRKDDDSVIIFRALKGPENPVNRVTVFTNHFIRDRNIEQVDLVPVSVCSFKEKIYGILKNDKKAGLYQISDEYNIVFRLLSEVEYGTTDIAICEYKDELLYAIITNGDLYYAQKSPHKFAAVYADVERIESTGHSILMFLKDSISEFVISEGNLCGFDFFPYVFHVENPPKETKLVEAYIAQIDIYLESKKKFLISIHSITGDQEIVYKNKTIHLPKSTSVDLVEGFGRSTINFHMPIKDFTAELLEVTLHYDLNSISIGIDINKYICQRVVNLPEEKLKEIKVLQQNENMEKMLSFQSYLKSFQNNNEEFGIIIDGNNRFRFISGFEAEKYMSNVNTRSFIENPFEELKNLVTQIAKGINTVKEWFIKQGDLIINGIKYAIKSLKEMVCGIMAAIAQIGIKVKEMYNVIIDIFNYDDMKKTSFYVNSFINKQLKLSRDMIQSKLKDQHIDVEKIQNTLKNDRLMSITTENMINFKKPKDDSQQFDMIYSNNYIKNAIEEEVYTVKSNYSNEIQKLMSDIMNSIPTEMHETTKLGEIINQTINEPIQFSNNPLKTFAEFFKSLYREIAELSGELIKVAKDIVEPKIVDFIDMFIKLLNKPVKISNHVIYMFIHTDEVTYISLLSMLMAFPINVCYKLMNKEKKGAFVIDVTSKSDYLYKSRFITHVMLCGDVMVNFAMPTYIDIGINGTITWISRVVYFIMNVSDLYSGFSYLSLSSFVVGLFSWTKYKYLNICASLFCAILSILSDNRVNNICTNALMFFCDAVDAFKRPGISAMLHVASTAYAAFIFALNMKTFSLVYETKYLGGILDGKSSSVYDTIEEYFNNNININYSSVILNAINETSPIALVFDCGDPRPTIIPMIEGQMYELDRIKSVELQYQANGTIGYININDKYKSGIIDKKIDKFYRIAFEDKDKIIALCIFQRKEIPSGIGFIGAVN